MSSPVETDELDKITKVKDEATSVGLADAAACIDEAVTSAVEEAITVDDDPSVGPVVTSKDKRKTSRV
jgi:hypothetical protein